MASRVARVVGPVTWFAVAWTALLAVVALSGVDERPLQTAARLVGMPLWFLAVHLALTAATPVCDHLHRRLGTGAVALWVAPVVVDVLARGTGAAWVGWANFAFVWMVAHQAGWAWRAGALAPRRSAATTAGIGLAALVLLTTRFGYPVAMVGLAGEASNTSPPTLALVAVGALQVGLLALARPRLQVLLERPGPWRIVIAANGIAVTAFLWHLSALCLAVVTVLRLGWFPTPAPGAAAWWALRPVWVVVLVLFTAPLVALFARVELRGPVLRPVLTRRDAAGRTGSAVVAFAAGCTLVALEGLPVVGHGAGPVAGVVALVAARRLLLAPARSPR